MDPGLQPVTPEEVSRRLNALASSSPHAEVVPIGTSSEGRPIEGLRLGAGERTGAPALALVANPSGPRAFESALALWLAERICALQDDDAAATRLLERTTVWIVPAPHPDGLARRFATPLTERLGVGAGIDDDRDGRMGEDPPEDLNGDGVISWMRVPDPDGRWRAADDDPRRTVEADAQKGERGVWKLVPEGRDRDGDGEIAEDAPHDTRLDLHFPAGWQEHEGESGLFPLDVPETRALADFFIGHPDIGLVLTFGDRDNLGKSPKGVAADAPRGKRVPPAGTIESDAELLAELGERYREITGAGERTSATLDGSPQRWLYEHRGILTLNAVLWEMPTEAPAEEGAAEGPAAEVDDAAEEAAEAETTDEPVADRPGAEGGEASLDAPEPTEAEAPGDEAETAEPSTKTQGSKGKKDQKDKPSDEAGQLAWIDAVDPERFLPWTPFEHPELGPVELGGFRPHTRREPPADAREEIADDQLAFLLGLGEVLPRLSIAECTAEALGGGLVRVRATLQNDGLLPLRIAAAARARTVRPAHLTLRLPEGARLLAGREHELVQNLEGSGGRAEFEWLVQTDDAGALEVHVDTDHAGNVSAKPSPTGPEPKGR